MDNWKLFELNIVKHSKILKIPCVKIPDHIIPIKGKIVRKKVAFDIAACVEGLGVFFDAKVESESNTFGLKSRVFHEKKIHQWSCLSEFSDGGAICGYLIWFVSRGKFVWANVDTINAALGRGEKSITTDTIGVVVTDDSDPIDLRIITKKDRQQWWSKHLASNT